LQLPFRLLSLRWMTRTSPPGVTAIPRFSHDRPQGQHRGLPHDYLRQTAEATARSATSSRLHLPHPALAPAGVAAGADAPWLPLC
jgi:hypothetical protein